MSDVFQQLNDLMTRALTIRPHVGGFPVMAEVLRQGGIILNRWTLPSCQSIYVMKRGSVVKVGTPLVTGADVVPPFNREALIAAIRTDQQGQSTFPEFLMAAWKAGVVSYDVDFQDRRVTYYSLTGESYTETYPAVTLPKGE